MFRTLAAALCVTAIAAQATEPIKLPAYESSSASLSDALRGRGTQRELRAPALSIHEASQLLWAAQGENRPGKRTAPSAREKYPLTVYILTEGSASLPHGTYRYVPSSHTLLKISTQGPKQVLAPIQGMQAWISATPTVCLITGKAGAFQMPRAEKAAYFEAGAASQNLALQATAMGLGSGVAMGVDLEAIVKALPLGDERGMALLPVGRTTHR